MKFSIDRQAYYSGAFIGNSVNNGCKPAVIAEVVSAPLVAVSSSCNPCGIPFMPTQAEDYLLQAVTECTTCYCSLFSSYAQCRSILSSTEKIDDEILPKLVGHVQAFMAKVCSRVIARHKQKITPIHLLEDHLIPSMKYFGTSVQCLSFKGFRSGESTGLLKSRCFFLVTTLMVL